MSENMKKKPREPRSGGGAEKHPAVLHGSSHDFDDLVGEIGRMSRKEVREKLQHEYNINPDEAVKRLKTTIDDALNTLRRDHHQPKEMRPAAPSRGVIAARGARPPLSERSSPRFIVESLRAAVSRDAALAVVGDAFEHLGVEADALRDHCDDPDAVTPLIEQVHDVAIVFAGHEDLWKPFADACARLTTRLAPEHQCLLVRRVSEQLEAEDAVSPAFVAELRRSFARVAPGNDATH